MDMRVVASAYKSPQGSLFGGTLSRPTLLNVRAL